MTTPPPLLASLVEQATEWASAVREADKQWSEPLSTLLEALAAENGALLEAATELRDDMLERARIEALRRKDDDLVVEAGAGVWFRFCQAIERTGDA